MQSVKQSQDRLGAQQQVMRQRRALLGGRVLITTLFLTACNSPSDVGQLSEPPPTAVAATVAQPYTIDSNGVLQTAVRAGAEVVLTGSSSHKGAQNTGVPIIYFDWQQVNAEQATAVDLIRRTPDTVSFTAPQVTADTVLTFQLKVADSNSATASATAMVKVLPIRDTDHFQNNLTVSDKFIVTAATSAEVPVSAGAAYNATLPFKVTVTKLATFTDINMTRQSMVAIGKPVTYSSGWSSARGSGGTNCADARNPQLQVPIPRLNLDDELADGSGHRLSDVLETSDIDRDPENTSIPAAVVYAKVEIQSTALPAGITPQVCVRDASGVYNPAPAAAITSSSDQLTAPSTEDAPHSSSASAHAYYAVIDPSHSKSTLNSWLSLNGFNPNSTDPKKRWGEDAHAVYTNNYDLGFGRDMYMKVGTCDAGAASRPLQERIGKCDVASVVVNYASVQAAANRLNPIVAVAMEYSAAPGMPAPGQRFVKFYVFAPDTRTGAFERVTSVDLDRRGQKSVPQACVFCHGSTPDALDLKGVRGSNDPTGNIGAGFLPWDIDSFLYSDTDPGFSQKPEDAALKAQFTRANQEPDFKLLNSGAYLTFDDPNRFALERELLEGWYGGAGLPSSFNGSFVPPGWKKGGANENPVGSELVYSQTFARYCRVCHIMQAPALVNNAYVDPRTAAQVTGSSAVPACSKSSGTPTRDYPPFGANQHYQFPMGCFWELVHAPRFRVPGALKIGAMPFSRRTMDRLWVQPDGSTSAGEGVLKLFAMYNSPPTVPPLKITTPGTTIAEITTPEPGQSNSVITVFPHDDLHTGAPAIVGNVVKLDSSRSAFADTYSWNASVCTGAPPPETPGECNRNVPVVGSTNPTAWLILDYAATYKVSLTIQGSKGPETATPYPFYYQVK